MSEWQERFHSYYGRGAPNDCWLWQRCLSTHGYGRFRLNGKTHTASRVAYGIAFGEIPDGLCVCHSCDSPACVNPAHLFLGTHRDNMDDRNSKGRSKKKLTHNDVSTIRAILRQGGITRVAIARMFGVTKGAIWHIEHGHVE